MFVYLEGDRVKGIPEKHVIIACPGGHLGVDKVLASWTEKTPDGATIGKTFHVEFIRGVACPEDALGQYLIDHNLAQRERWRAPAGSVVAEADPLWRWRADAPEE